jgi:RNA recognition motif-containing protein
MTHPLICPCLSSVIAITRTFRQESDEDIERKSRSCFVGNLSFECDEDQLSNWCSSAGQVVSSVVMRRGKRSTGSGLVEFTDVAAAQNAVATLNGTEMDGRVILVREDRVAAVQQTENDAARQEKKSRKERFSEMDPSQKVVEPNKVFVQNLTWDTTEEELVAAFCPVADVTSVEIRQVDRAEQSRVELSRAERSVMCVEGRG